MYNKKLGFTIAETLVCLGIISIILIYALTTMKPNQKAMKYLYRNAYSALHRAYYNGLMEGHEPFKPDLVHSDTSDEGTEQLCRALSSFINTTDTTMQDGKDYSASCSPTKLISELGNEEDFKKGNKNMQFVAAGSGMVFYITKKLNMEEGEIPFYLIFVDINGIDRGPNRMTYDDKQAVIPDIYAFAATDASYIIPLGIPEYDTRLLSSRIAYFSEQGDELYTKISKPYYQSKGEAWGYYSSVADPVASKLPEEALTMNDYIRSKIDPNSNIVKDFPDLTQPPYEPLPLAGEKYGCVKLDLEACYVIIDEYRY